MLPLTVLLLVTSAVTVTGVPGVTALADRLALCVIMLGRDIGWIVVDVTEPEEPFGGGAPVPIND